MKNVKKRGRPSSKNEKTSESEIEGRPSRSSAGKKVFEGFVCLESKKRKRSDVEATEEISSKEKRSKSDVEDVSTSLSSVNVEAQGIFDRSIEETTNEIQDKSLEKPKRRPGRPKKSIQKNESVATIEPKDKLSVSFENGEFSEKPITPKKRPSGLKKMIENCQESLSDSPNIGNPESDVEKSKKLIESENSESQSNLDSEIKPIRRPGRPKKSKINEVENNIETVKSDIEKPEPLENGDSLNTEIQPKRRPGRREKSKISLVDSDETIVENDGLPNVKLDSEVKPKRRPGRPRKSEQNHELENSEEGEIDVSDSEVKPKRRPGRPRKSEQNHELENSEEGEIDVSDSEVKPKRRPGRPRKSEQNHELENSEEGEIDVSDSEVKPKRRPGRPRKSEQNHELENSEEGEIDVSDSEVKPKRRPGRPRKSEQNHELENSEEGEIDVSDSEVKPKRRSGRPRKKEQDYELEDSEEEEDSDSEIELQRPRKSIQNQKLIDRVENYDPDSEVKPKKKAGRPRKSVLENSGDEGENARNKRYTSFDPDSASGHLERLDFLTSVKNKNRMVECAICEEKMAVVVYQNQHMAKHNYLCWLKGEKALDLNNEILIERLLTRVKVYLPKTSFSCQLCGNKKKSARGFISHRQFCGKTQEEKKNLMVTCKLCARVVMPTSFEIHMAAHNAKKVENPEPLTARKAAEKFLRNVSKRSETVDDDDSEDDFSEFYNIVKYNKRDYINLWEEKCLNDETISCPCPDCDFKTDRLTQMKKHFKDCSKTATKYQCSECEYSSSDLNEIVSHIKELHSLNVSMARQKKEVKDCNFQNGLLFIPFLKNTEAYLHYKVHPSKFFPPAISWTKQQRSIHYSSEKLFLNFSVKKADWEIKTEKDLKNYFQDTEKSLRISLNSENWFTLNKYEVRTEENMSLVFCGGPVFALAWAPGTGVQYLAVGAHRSMTNVYQVGSTCSDPANIQIWSFPQMGNKKTSSLENVKLEYLICHESGGAWGMEWCPSGCRDDERLGLLAVNCASGSIPIFSIPIPKSDHNLPACKPQPILTLELGPNEKSQCCKISWSKVKPHRIIAGGFVNGYVALWDVMTESFLLKKGRTLYPYRIFQAHHSIITGVVFSPTSDTILATSSNDKSLKFWDLTDTTCPISKQSKNSPTDLTWLSHWMSCSTSIENILASGDFNMTMSCIRDFTYEPQTYLSNIDSTSMSISGNDWLNGLATCFDNGQVNIVCSRRQPLTSHDERKKYIKVIIEPNLFDFDKEAYAEKPKNKEHPKFEISESQSYSETTAKYGINFKTDLRFGFEDRLKGNSVNPIHMYPINTANKVCWNPNMDSFTNLAVGYQSGFVFVSKLNFCVLDQNLIEDVFKD